MHSIFRVLFGFIEFKLLLLPLTYVEHQASSIRYEMVEEVEVMK